MTTSAQLRAGRSLLGLTQPQLAAAANVSTMTLKRAEGSGQPAASADAVGKIQRALEKAGVIFVDENGEGAGVRLRKSKRR